MLDQIGAFIGPVLLYLAMLFKTEGTTFEIHSTCFAVLSHPRRDNAHPPHRHALQVPEPPSILNRTQGIHSLQDEKRSSSSILRVSASFAFGFIDYSIIIMHVSRTYSHLAPGLSERRRARSSRPAACRFLRGAMLVDAVAALFFGMMYDKNGVKASYGRRSSLRRLRCSCSRSIPCRCCSSASRSGGVGMGAQESILSAAVTSMAPKASRATGYGVFECSFGAFWLRQLAHGRAVRCQHPGDDRRFGHRAACGDPALHRLFKADEERRMRRSQ